MNLRPGVSRLREELEAAAGRPVRELTGAAGRAIPSGSSAGADGDTSTSPVAGDDVDVDVDVVVGTEAALHRVRRVDTVVFLDLDAELLAPRYRAGEQALGLVARAARLVGGRDGGGRVLIQTFLPDHEVIDAVRHADPARCTEALRAPRRLLGFPPDGALAAVSGAEVEIATYAAELRRFAGVEVRGPVDGRLLVRAADAELLADALATAVRPHGSRLRIEVDPPRV